MENVKTLCQAMKEHVDGYNTIKCGPQLKGDIIVSIDNMIEFYDENTGEKLTNLKPAHYSFDYKYDKQVNKREYSSFLNPLVIFNHDAIDDKNVNLDVVNTLRFFSDRDLTDLEIEQVNNGENILQNTFGAVQVTPARLLGKLYTQQICDILSKVPENGVVYFDIVEKIKGKALTSEENEARIKSISASLSNSTDLAMNRSKYNLDTIPVLDNTASNRSDISIFDYDYNFVVSGEPEIEIRNIITTREELINHLKAHSNVAGHKYIEEIFSKVYNDQSVVERTEAVINQIGEISKRWLTNTTAPACDPKIGNSYYIGIAGGELADRFRDYWKRVENYIHVKEFAESIVTANETKLINRCYNSLKDEISIAELGRYTQTYSSQHTPIQYWSIDKLRAYVPFWATPVRFDVNADLSLPILVKHLDKFVDYINSSVEFDDDYTEVINTHALNIPDNLLNPIVYGFIKMDVNAMKSYIPKIENLVKILSAKYDRHVARTMDFSSCTIDNVTNYVEERKIRISILDNLVVSLKTVLKVIESIETPEITILELYDILIEKFNIHHYAMSNSTGYLSKLISSFDKCFTLCDTLDAFYPEADSIDKKFNVILKTGIHSGLIAKYSSSFGLNIKNEKSVTDFNMFKQIIETMNSISNTNK